MRNQRDTGTPLSTLLSLVILYVTLIVLVLVFAGQVLRDLSFTQSGSSVVIIVLAIVFPILLLTFVAVNIVRILRERSVGRPGARFKLRLLFFFMVIVLLASVPQGALSVNFIRTAVQAWFSEDTGEAIRGGQRIALSFFNERQQELQGFARGRYLESLLAGVESQPERVWNLIQGVNPAIDAMQLFDEDFAERFFAGPNELKLSPLQAAAARGQQVARESIAGTSFLRVRAEYSPPAPAGLPADSPGFGGAGLGSVVSPAAYTVILSVTLPPGFDQSAGALTDALEFFVQLERFQGNFITAIGIFYAFFSVPLILLSILVSFFLSDEIIRPIVRLEEATRRVAEGDFSIRILSRRGDELATLVDSFNRMVGELDRTRTKIIQTEKIAAWQEIAQRLAHEIKNPLTPIRLAAERALRKHDTNSPDFVDVFRSSVHSIIEEVDNLNSLLTEFREFSRLPEPTLRPVALRPVVDEVANMYGQSGLEASQDAPYAISVDISEGVIVNADQGQLKQVFANLFKNSMEAMPAGGRIDVATDIVKKGESTYCRIQVGDDGPGIQSEYQEKVFAPYVTTKHHGTGLGLAIVERIVFDHNGQIWFETQQGVGTTFFVDIPLAEPERREDTP